MSSDTYNVYLSVYSDMLRDHHAIWIDTNTKMTFSNGESVGVGELIQVTGNIQQGMAFEIKNDVDPVKSNEGKEKHKIGTVQKEDLEKLRQICRDLSAPPKRFDGPKKIYPARPLYRCQKWTNEDIQRLRVANFLQATTS